MSTMNETFGNGGNTVSDELNRRRDLAQAVDDLGVADIIWQKIVEKFYSFSGLELERLSYVSVVLSQMKNGLSLEVIANDATRYKIDNKTKLSEKIILSDKKLERIKSIMSIVVNVAKQHGIMPWNNDGKDDGIERGDNIVTYGFVWQNSNFPS